MHYFSDKFSKIATQRPLTFNIDDLKFRDLAKLWLAFKLIITKFNFKK